VCCVQFLPQDKVVEFAQMDQYQLLVATEKAIGDASLYKTHQRLNQKRELVKERQNVRALALAVHSCLACSVAMRLEWAGADREIVPSLCTVACVTVYMPLAAKGTVTSKAVEPAEGCRA
jgi:hypothetical protein